MRSKNRWITLVLIGGMAVTVVLASHTTGSVTLLGSPPVDLTFRVGMGGPDAGPESDTEIRCYVERQGHTLSAPVVVDISASGGASIPAGTVVDSYTCRFDPESFGGTTAPPGSISFDEGVLGLILLDASLDSSDLELGNGGTIYHLPGPGRGIEFNDQVSLSADQKTVSFNLEVGGNQDQVRVVASPAQVIPTLSGWGIILLVAALMIAATAMILRRQRTAGALS